MEQRSNAREVIERKLLEQLGSNFEKCIVIDLPNYGKVDVFIQVKNDLIYENTDYYEDLYNSLSDMGYRNILLCSGNPINVEV